MEAHAVYFRLVNQCFAGCVCPCDAAHFGSHGPNGDIRAIILGAVACRIDAFYGRSHVLVYDDRSVCCQTSVFCDGNVCSNACGYQHQVCRDFFAVSHNAVHMFCAADFVDLHANLDFDAFLFCHICQDAHGFGVYLARHQNGSAFQNRYIQLCFPQFPSCFQTQHAAANHDCILCALRQNIDLFHVLDGTDGYHFGQVLAFERRDEAGGTQCIDTFIIGEYRAVCQDDFFFLCIQFFHFAVQPQVNVVFFVPFRLFAGNGTVRNCTEHCLCQHRSVIRQFIFFRQHHDGSGLISQPDGFRRIQRRSAAAQDDKFFRRVLAEAGIRIFHGNEVFCAYAANGAGFHIGIENFAANQAFHQMAPCGRFLFFALQQLHAKLIAELKGFCQVFFRRSQAYLEAIHHPQVDLFQSFNDMRHTLAAPAVAAESGSQLAAVDGGIHTCGQIPDGFQRLLQDGRCTEEDTIGCADLACHFPCIRRYHIVAFYIDIPGFFDAFCDLAGQFFRVAVSTYIRDNDSRFFVCGHFTPCVINGHQFRNVAVQHGAVTGTDHIDIQFPHTLHSFHHIGLLEGAQDVVKIIFCGSQIAFVICHCAAQDAFVGIMGTEGVACHQCFVFHYISIHGIGPVQVRHHQETQGLAADLHFVAIIHRDRIEIFIHDLFQEGNRCCSRDDLHLGVFPDHPHDGTSVVRLCVAHNDIIDGLDIQLFQQGFSVVIVEFFLGCFKEDGLIPRLQNVGVIGRTKFCIHDDIEYPQVFIQNACPVKVVFQPHCSHKIHLSD